MVVIAGEARQSHPRVIAGEAWKSLIENVITRNEETW